MQFNLIYYVQGKPVAELQLTNTRAGVVRRPFDMSLSLSVQSLLLVDALQTFGPDYELLVASHRNVSVDSVSGSLRGASSPEPGSPGSGTSSSPPSHRDLSLALASLSDRGNSGNNSSRTFLSPTPDHLQSRLEARWLLNVLLTTSSILFLNNVFSLKKIVVRGHTFTICMSVFIPVINIQWWFKN